MKDSSAFVVVMMMMSALIGDGDYRNCDTFRLVADNDNENFVLDGILTGFFSSQSPLFCVSARNESHNQAGSVRAGANCLLK